MIDHESAGTAFDPDAVGYERQGRKTEPEIRYLGDLQRLELKSGDILVVKTPDLLPQEVRQQIITQIQAIVGQDHPVFVFHKTWDIGIISPVPE